MINFYRDVIEKRSHILAPLKYLVAVTAKKNGSKKKQYRFVVLQHHIEAFNRAKNMIKTEVKLSLPDFKMLFHLYADASDI